MTRAFFRGFAAARDDRRADGVVYLKGASARFFLKGAAAAAAA